MHCSRPPACALGRCDAIAAVRLRCKLSLHGYKGKHVTKEELRAELERQEKRYKDVYGGEITTYAAQPEPERKPWRKRASLLDQAFQEELEKIEKELKSPEVS